MSARTHHIVDSPIGVLTLVNTEGLLSGLHMQTRAHGPDESGLGERTHRGFERVSEQLAEYFAGERREFDLELAAEGTAFQHRVWEVLVTIPYGQTRSYSQIAGQLGEPGWEAARAVGAANARNPIGIVVPCHRVIGADGSLTGYAGGLERKKFLLALENPARMIEEPLFA